MTRRRRIAVAAWLVLATAIAAPTVSGGEVAQPHPTPNVATPEHGPVTLHRAHHRPPPMKTAKASNYDGSAPACGRHYRMGFASRWSRSTCGARVRFCYHGHCAVGRREDWGPAIYSRRFDLTPALNRALRYSTDHRLRWRRLGR